MCAFDWNNQLIKRYENDINKIRTWWFDFKCMFLLSQIFHPLGWWFSTVPLQSAWLSQWRDRIDGKMTTSDIWYIATGFDFKQIQCTDSTTWLMFSAAKNRARSQHLVHGQHILIPQPAASYQQVGFVYGNAAGVMSESCHYVIMFFLQTRVAGSTQWYWLWQHLWNTGIPFEN